MYLSCLSSQSLRLSCVFCNLFFLRPSKDIYKLSAERARGLFCSKSRGGNEEWHTLLLRGSKSVTLQLLYVLCPFHPQMSPNAYSNLLCLGVVSRLSLCWNSNHTYIKLSHGCFSGKFLGCFFGRERTNVCSSSFLLEDWKTTTALHPQITLDLK